MRFKDKPKSKNAQSDKKVARSIQLAGVFVDANPLGHLARIGRPNVKFAKAGRLYQHRGQVCPLEEEVRVSCNEAFIATLKRHARTRFRSIVAAVFELD
jgi:hypothetical protein